VRKIKIPLLTEPGGESYLISTLEKESQKTEIEESVKVVLVWMCALVLERKGNPENSSVGKKKRVSKTKIWLSPTPRLPIDR
jgi:hypothetical protein